MAFSDFSGLKLRMSRKGPSCADANEQVGFLGKCVILSLENVCLHDPSSPWPVWVTCLAQCHPLWSWAGSTSGQCRVTSLNQTAAELDCEHQRKVSALTRNPLAHSPAFCALGEGALQRDAFLSFLSCLGAILALGNEKCILVLLRWEITDLEIQV